MENRLKYILELVNQWLKFAETKNAALLGTNSAIVFLVIKSLDSISSLYCFLRVYIAVASVAMVISAALSIISFVPLTEINSQSTKKEQSEDDNLIFYGDISTYEPRSYVKALYAHIGQDKETPTQIEVNYAEQIINNSRIALIKYRLFSIGAWITLFSILTPIVSLPIFLFRKQI